MGWIHLVFIGFAPLFAASASASASGFARALARALLALAGSAATAHLRVFFVFCVSAHFGEFQITLATILVLVLVLVLVVLAVLVMLVVLIVLVVLVVLVVLTGLRSCHVRYVYITIILKNTQL